ncbi:uncharacterized protein MELLADRAFT_60682 [Melampsora larici-populina 98AG31]|uniref:Endopeptidase S2P n=1 Tax=Melampsora larici-populina (strain 98AG31 / pathotype 3-4-7) TaxID=747676 RepID=F4RBY4_MELLP|nr:uncharacterized protein MELLADRAFT_60682 [Melampsora larici-populina 98AG31]EGG10258.1 hypothetical protein MELLADRAFT_60682 [Melampsora larici-populina 98AG31]
MSHSVLLILISIGIPWLLLYLSHLRVIDIFPSRRQLSGSRSSFDTVPITFDTGFGWLRFHTQRFNRTSYRLLKSIGATEVSSGPDPKSFDPEPLPYRDRRDGQPSRRVHNTLETLYDIGTILILILQLFALLTLAFLFFQIVYHTIFSSPHRTLIQTNSTISVSERVKGLVRRSTSFEPTTLNKPIVQTERSSRFSLKPLIPGLTIPLDQAPIYLSALLISQAYHEFGHAFVAALNNVPMIASGFILAFPFFPIFYVSILSILPPTSHPNSQFISLLNLRMATAGIWHNLVMASIGWLFWNDGADWAGYLFRLTGGWADVGDLGVGVVTVRKTSSISSVLLPKEIITDLNDFSLSLNSSTTLPSRFPKLPLQKWEKYLLSDYIWLNSDQKGWCMNNSNFLNLDSKCCQRHNEQNPKENESRPICFKALHQAGCLNPRTVSEMMENSIRCHTDQECKSEKGGGICVRPDEESKLLRLKWIFFKSDCPISRFNVGNLRKWYESYLIFLGMGTILDLKKMDTKPIRDSTPKFPKVCVFAHQYLQVLETFEDESDEYFSHELSSSYLISISIGIGFLNLLPIKRLDGSSIVESLLHFHTSKSIQSSETRLKIENFEISDEIDEYNSFGHIKPNLFNRQIDLKKSIQNSFVFKFKFMEKISRDVSRYFVHKDSSQPLHSPLPAWPYVVNWVARPDPRLYVFAIKVWPSSGVYQLSLNILGVMQLCADVRLRKF